ncbi:hypothetical protein ACFY0A_37375 [Streptomyces sp. NPDC001698]|uniref:hypothetical protein n=1 Tax=Streptomyces sp. NPDC001698 TaxID=3364601 RepID=UPI0036B2C637
MPVEPVPCQPEGGGGTPVEVTTCCSPSIASAPLCQPDGTTILAVVRSGCVECGQTAEDPAIVGWLDTGGSFTPGPLPADAGPCEAGCVDTVCRTLCDDTDGDGAPDATYSELWCIRANGTAELVLTYQDDPSQPYTPVSPVECTYGCPETETVQLCDDDGARTLTPFLRRYTWLNGAATFEDFALDGITPHIVSGTVTTCSSTGSAPEECAERTTPAATLGLCLADGTPIAVLVTRDCDGTVTRDGWLNLTTGAYSAGDPPAGTIACGDSRSISVTGTFCDIDPASGDVLGLVLVEYSYAADGSIDAVRLVDAVTGQTYTPQGEVTTCPAGVAQPERDLVQLCDTAADGTVTEFVRDYARDENGQITGHTDYRLDGAPYTPTGTVGRCADQCRDCETVLLCDTNGLPPATITGTAASGTLSNGVTWTSTGTAALPPTRQGDGAAWWGSAVLPNPAIPTNLWTFNQPVNVDFSVVMNWASGTSPGENQAQLPAGAVPLSLPPGYTWDPATHILSADSTLTACTVATPTRAASARFRVTGVTSLTLRYLGTRTTNVPCRITGHWVFGALDVSLGGPFLRTVCRDCTGTVTSTTDTLLDGKTPYAPTGLVGVCPPTSEGGEDCHNSTTVLVCDLPASNTVTVTPRIVDATTAAVAQTQFQDLPGPYTPLWTGGTLAYPAGTGPGQQHSAVTGRITATAPAGCEGNGGVLTVTVRVTQNGPGTGQDWDGALRIFRGTTVLFNKDVLRWAPPGYVQTITATVPVTAADLASGQLYVALMLETFHISAKSWTADQFSAKIELDGCEQTTAVQFLRTVVTDCETGAVVSTSDSTLDGAPYTPTGDVGQCTPASGGGDGGECCDTGNTLTLCDVVEDGTSTPFLRRLTYTPGIATPAVADFALDGTTPYTALGTVGLCQEEPADPEARVDVETTLLCVRDQASGEITGQVIAERAYDDQTGDLVEQRLTDLAGDPYTLPAGSELTKCPSPDRITRQVCVVESGSTEFLTNAANATSGQDTDWQWAPNLTGLWHPMYRVAPNAAWTATDTAPNKAHWVSPHSDRTVCPTTGETSPPVPGTWYTRASWNLPANVAPDSIRIAATVLNADNKVVQWRLNDGAWQPVGGGTLATPAWTFPPTAVPGGRAGQNEVVVQLLETAPAVSCPSPNQAGMILHVIATYDHEPRVWTQVIEPGGQTYYLDENGDRQDAIPAGQRLVPCGGGGDAPCCPAVNTDVLTLCDTAADGSVTSFLRHLTFTEGAAAPAVRDTALDGTSPYTPAGTVGTCQGTAEGRDVELTPWCVIDNASGRVIQQILAEVTYDQATGDRLSVRYVDPLTWGPVALPGGTHLDVCPDAQPDNGPCRNSNSLLLCDLPTDGTPAATATDTSPTPYYPYATGSPVTGAQALWDGGTLDLPPGTEPQPGTPGTVRSLAATIQAPRPACDTGTAHVTVSVKVQQTGPDDGCGPTGHLRLFNGTTQTALTVLPANTPFGYFGTLTVEADVPAADLAAGAIAVALALDAYDDSPSCTPSPRRTGWQLSAFTVTAAYDQTGCDTQFLRTVTVDCETGAVTAVADSTLDGQPYTPTGEPGQCTPASSGGTVVEPCGDTEVAQLCDLTYDPQAPIPTPASDFTLTGNVVAANGGTTLWFAQANQPANGVAELTVSGLLPTVLYEFRFASAWIGAGAPDPTNNNAIYLLEVLDDATVIATRTRNTSNGSNVFPGGVLSEDLPPLAFIAPATGAVTIRFTDQTTGGPFNDRDLFLMPLEVRTAALTLKRTPFLRRFTFDCDGALTSTQDLGLDGATPYVVQGEAGQCTADGTTAGVVTPCDVQSTHVECRRDDTTGDGEPDTSYVELIGVDCQGQLTSLGTYTEGLTAPYTPVSPVDCGPADDEGADPAFGVQARRVEVTAGQSWDAAAWPTLQSVTAVAHGAEGTVTTSDGPSTLHTGESATWSVARDDDARLTGPLVIKAGTGTVTVTWTHTVTL